MIGIGIDYREVLTQFVQCDPDKLPLLIRAGTIEFIWLPCGVTIAIVLLQ